jgi:hypothetical protein
MPQFTSEERSFMETMSTCPESHINVECNCYRILQILGLIILGLTAFLAARFFTNKTILILIIPYFLTGIFVLIQGVSGKRAMKNRKLMSSISKKILEETTPGE